MNWKPLPPPVIVEVKMTHEKALELLAELQHSLEALGSPDTKTALTMAQTALITEKLHLGE